MYILDNHDEKRQFDAQSFIFAGRAGDEGRGDVRAHDLEHRRLDILISQPLYMPILD